MSVLGPHDVVVIGAGVVGLGVARALAMAGRRVLVIEREVAAGKVGSSRSSGVVHAGLHHPDGWLKTTMCLRGRPMLEAYCQRRGVPLARTGKWVVATEESERARLQALAARAAARRIPHRLVEGTELVGLEPNVTARAGLLVEATGVVRTAELVRALVGDLEEHGGELLVGVEVMRVGAGEVVLPEVTLRAATIVIAAGLFSDVLLCRSGLDAAALGLEQHPAKGEWVALSERHRKGVSRHVYPVPHADGAALGVHLTRDVDGFLYAGPDLTWGDASFSLSPEKVPHFLEAIRRFYPHVRADELHPVMAGVRPKLSRRGEPARDFCVWRGGEHGLDGVIALVGIESPGLTACLALGEHVAALV
jgi:L-2-hydroxyglutarate oxidase LhgO